MSHDRALYIKKHWIRDPYIVYAPDGFYYLTGTTPNPGDPRENRDPYNKGLFEGSIVGATVQIWRSRNLIDWEYQGVSFTTKDTYHYDDENRAEVKSPNKNFIWAPEIHWDENRNKWILVHCPQVNSSFVLSDGSDVKGPWIHTMGKNFDKKHDPSLFRDDDGTWYAIWANAYIAQISSDLTRFETEPVFIEPSGSRPDPKNPGSTISRIGHEGCTIKKIGGKYVLFGTAWSTDTGRKGSYNLYYTVADKIVGPYGPRRFAGRFLGHGTPFQTKDGKWWCTAFYNGDVPPVSSKGIQDVDLSATAQTVNLQGTTIVPLEVKFLKNGELYIRAKDPAYAVPGPDENQKF
ncbi:MAG: family 43 glycosylhydrolase [Proteiniphilum sp.]|nr:family 43 glycosylhydrolase [Proteiniphilum sp.]